MRRHCRRGSLAILCGLFAHAVQAADPAPLATRFTPATSARDSGVGPAKAAATAANPSVNPAKATFADRMQAARQLEQQTQQSTSAQNHPKPTQWQLQNPANPLNNLPTGMTGPIASNNYFGAQFQQWSNLSQPAPMTQLPFNQTSVPTFDQTHVYTAPNTYYGSQFSNWSNLRSGQFEPNPFGGWNYR